MSHKLYNKHAFSPGALYSGHLQFENYSDLNDNYKIWYLYKDVKCFTKLNLAFFKDLGEGVVIVKLPNI